MASSRVMASASSTTASNITQQSSLYSIKSLTSMNIDDLFRIESGGAGIATSPAVSRQGSISKVEWGEVGNNDGGAAAAAEMTLEDFLERAGMEGAGVATARGRKRGNGSGGTLDPVEKAAMQRQKRMIKNRESAARSRERKQAYTAELEALVAQLEEENAELVRYQEEQQKKRLKQLSENLVPTTKGIKPCKLRKTRSMEW